QASSRTARPEQSSPWKAPTPGHASAPPEPDDHAPAGITHRIRFLSRLGAADRDLRILPWRTSSGIGRNYVGSMFARMSHGAGESSVAVRDLRASAAGSAEKRLGAAGRAGREAVAGPGTPKVLISWRCRSFRTTSVLVTGTGGELRTVSTA